jgi:cold shock CspA family protein
MAKPISFNNKRELEKERQKKQLEKQKRKEERKANGANGSFEDMIAYVDENGVITSTPPDPQKKQEVDAENIAISTPKKEETEETALRGRVEYFNSDKGYGFIKDTGSTEKYFFHISCAPSSITEGNMVTFELERGKKGMNAVNITIEK